MSVSSEEHYQPVLGQLRKPGQDEAKVVATLIRASGGNPWKEASISLVLEVKVDGETVGFLTPAMTRRYLSFVEQAEAMGSQLTCTAVVQDGSARGGRPTEITLDAIPMWEGQTNIDGLDVEKLPDCILEEDRNIAHEIDGDGDVMRAVCGQVFSTAGAHIVYRTKPWVGRALADGTLVEYPEARCPQCRDDWGNDPDEGGRFGDQTTVSRDHRFNAKLTPEGLAERLPHHVDFDVAGESFHPDYPENLHRVAETLMTISGPEYLACVLRRNPENKYDSNAIEVHVTSEAGMVGHVPKELAALLAPIMDGGAAIRAWAVEVRIDPARPQYPGLTVRIQQVEEGHR